MSRVASIIELNLESTPAAAHWTVLAGCLAGAAIYWTPIQRIVQFMLRVLMRCLYRVRIHGMENWPEKGGAVIVANHSTWIDGAIMLFIAPRRTRMIAWSGNFKIKPMIWLARFSDVILMSGGPKSIRRGLEQAREAIESGQIAGIFPEGGLSRTGQLQSFKPGLMKIVENSGAPVIPIYIDQMWGSIFSFYRGGSVLQFPRSFRRPLSIHIGKPIEKPKNVFEVRQRVQLLGAEAMSKRHGAFVSPARHFIRKCRKRLFRFKAADSAKTVVTGGTALMRALIARRLIRKHVLERDEQSVGILIPPSFGGVAVNVALALDKRIAINLNYTVSNEIMNECIRMAGIRHVLTSRKVMEKFDFEFDCDVVYLEDMRDKVGLVDKIVGVLMAYILPAFVTERILGLHRSSPDDVMTVIFTSGSTGTPKGVMLTNKNIATNVAAMEQVVRLNNEDIVLGVLPFFHSFGYTITLWGSMSLNIGGVFHFSPLDANVVGKMCEQYGVTILLATPTFLRGYLRKCTPEQFKTIDVVVAGAEKLPIELCNAYEKKFNVRPVEGYGATELSPLVTVNVPPSRRGDNFQVDCKEGTVGRPIPNVAAKVTHVETGDEVAANEEGTLWITGPNVMKGYLNREDLTSEVIVDGWYNTGDIALIDDDGFVKITGRISRFSKIGGEMVPHVKIEETLSQLLDPEEQDELRIAVTAVADPKKGERLVVLHTELKKSAKELCQGLAEAGLPNIYIPAENSFLKVDELPLLGTGKLDLRAIKEQAQSLTAK